MCIPLCLVELKFSGGRIHYEAYFTAYYLPKKKKKKKRYSIKVHHFSQAFMFPVFARPHFIK